MARATLQLKLNKGQLIDGRYVIIKKLGEGGCGSVYRCRHVQRPDLEVAIKVLENAADLPRFKREQKVLNSVRNAHVVRLLDHGTHDRHPYLVLEFMDGGSLRELLNNRGRLSPEEACWVLVQAVRGLRASRTVHRDLKPENLLVGRGRTGKGIALMVGDTRKGAVVKVADFGLAKQRDPSQTALTNTGQIMGTPLYMSPEQCRNTRDVTTQSDIYALGVLLFEMLFGNPPFDADNAYDIMAKHCNDEPKIPRNLDPRLRTVLARTLAKNPKERYRSLLALERDLAAIAGLGEPEADRSKAPMWIFLAIATAALAATGWLLRERVVELLSHWWNGTG